MLNQLFKYPRVLNRYLTSPLLDLRLDYLRHCAEQGFAQISLQLIAYYQLIITDYLSLQTARTITPSEIEAAADRWAQHPVLYAGRMSHFHFPLAIALSRTPLTGCSF